MSRSLRPRSIHPRPHHPFYCPKPVLQNQIVSKNRLAHFFVAERHLPTVVGGLTMGQPCRHFFPPVSPSSAARATERTGVNASGNHLGKQPAQSRPGPGERLRISQSLSDCAAADPSRAGGFLSCSCNRFLHRSFPREENSGVPGSHCGPGWHGAAVCSTSTALVIKRAIRREQVSTRRICRVFASSLGLTPRTRLNSAHTADCGCNHASRS